MTLITNFFSGVANSISEGDIFIYSCSAQLISFEIKSILKEINCAEHKYMNMPPSLIELATPLNFCLPVFFSFREKTVRALFIFTYSPGRTIQFYDGMVPPT